MTDQRINTGIRRSLGTFDLTADTTPDELEFGEHPRENGQLVWYDFVNIGGPMDIVYNQADKEGIRIDTGEPPKGPFLMATAPRFFFANSSTSVTVTVLTNG